MAGRIEKFTHRLNDDTVFRRRIFSGLLAGLLVAYLVQGFSPIRMNNDSVAYLHMARSHWLGQGFTIFGETSFLPTGYPAILAFVHEIGLANPFVFVALNNIFLFGGVLAYHRLFRKAYGLSGAESLLLVLLIPLSFVALKHAVLTVSESAFLFVSAIALLALHGAAVDRSRRRLLLLLLGAVLVAEAVWIRTVGIAFIPAILFAALLPVAQLRAAEIFKGKRTFAALILILAVAVAAIFGLRSFTSYDDIIVDLFRKSVSETSLGGVLLKHFGWKLSEISQIAMNTPLSIVPERLKMVFLIFGAVAATLIVRGIATRFKALSIPDIYFLSFAAIVLAWHFHDPRFWLPVIPFLILYLYLGLRHYSRFTLFRLGIKVWLVAFTVMGGLALAYSTVLTFSGNRFADRYGDGTYREIYRAALNGEAMVNASEFGEREMAVLKWYEPRVRSK